MSEHYRARANHGKSVGHLRRWRATESITASSDVPRDSFQGEALEILRVCFQTASSLKSAQMQQARFELEIRF